MVKGGASFRVSPYLFQQAHPNLQPLHKNWALRICKHLDNQANPSDYFSLLIFSFCDMEIRQNRRLRFHPKLCHFSWMWREPLLITYRSCINGEHWGCSTQHNGLHPSWNMNSVFLWVARTRAGHCLGLRTPSRCFLRWGENIYLPAIPQGLVQKCTFTGEVIRHPQDFPLAVEPKPVWDAPLESLVFTTTRGKQCSMPALSVKAKYWWKKLSGHSIRSPTQLL